MNGDSPHGGPPWSVDLLADLHADGGDRSGLDADALEVLAALDAAQADLASLPPMRMPDHVAARLDIALAAEVHARSGPMPLTVPPQPSAPVADMGRPSVGLPSTAPTAPVVDLAEARRRRSRRFGIAGGLLAAAAVAVGVVVVTVPGGSTGGTPQAVPGQTSIQTDPQNGPLALTRSDLPGAGVKAYGNTDYGPYKDTAKLSDCLAANGVTTKPLAGRRVTVDGHPGVMMLLPVGQLNHVQLLIVGNDCGAGRPDMIINTTLGG